MFTRKGKKKLPPDREAERILRSHQQAIQDDMCKRLTALQHSITAMPDNLAEEVLEAFAFTKVLAKGATRLQQSLEASPGREVQPRIVGAPHYVVSEVLLHHGVHHLIGDKKGRERVLLVTGVENNGATIITETLLVPTIEQSTTGVAAHPGHTAVLIDRLNEQGHQLQCVWHSHPTSGRHSTRPSARDLAHQKRLADFGMAHVLGGIASRCGKWFRIFNPAQKFTIDIYGSGSVEIIKDAPHEKVLQLKPQEVKHGPVGHAVLAAP